MLAPQPWSQQELWLQEAQGLTCPSHCQAVTMPPQGTPGHLGGPWRPSTHETLGSEITNSGERKPQDSLHGAGPKLARGCHQPWDSALSPARRALARPWAVSVETPRRAAQVPAPACAWPQELVFTNTPVPQKNVHRPMGGGAAARTLSVGARRARSLTAGPARSTFAGSAKGTA